MSVKSSRADGLSNQYQVTTAENETPARGVTATFTILSQASDRVEACRPSVWGRSAPTEPSIHLDEMVTFQSAPGAGWSPWRDSQPKETWHQRYHDPQVDECKSEDRLVVAADEKVHTESCTGWSSPTPGWRTATPAVIFD